MAIIDYGVIGKKNKRILTKNLFTPMKETLGVSIEKSDEGKNIDGNHFLYLGDKDFYVAIYGCTISVYNKNKKIDCIYGVEDYDYTYRKFRLKKTIDGITLDIKRIDNKNRFYCRFLYKGDVYEFIYGYGVDIDIKSWYELNNKCLNKFNKFYKDVV